MSESEVKPSSGSIKSEREKYEPKSRDEVEKEMGGIGFDQVREEKKKAEEADQESVLFSCVRCGLNEMCHYLGRYVEQTMTYRFCLFYKVKLVLHLAFHNRTNYYLYIFCSTNSNLPVEQTITYVEQTTTTICRTNLT